MGIFVITSPDGVAEESRWINELCASGVHRMHIRKPNWNGDDIRQLLEEIDKRYYPFLTLHSHHSLVSEFGLGGMHFPTKYRSKMPSKVKEGLIFSSSFHQYDEVGAWESKIDFAFVSPVFPSISKVGYSSEVEWEASTSWQREHFVALGGIELTKLEELKRRGFGHIALLGALWSNTEGLIERFQKIKERWEAP